MIKAKIKLLLHSILGFERFLYYFSLFKIRTLRSDKNEKDIFLFTEKINEQKSEGIVLDIGANIGIMTGAIAQNTKAYIHAFEPLPLNSKIFERVVEKLKLTDRVTLHKMALGNTEGFCEMVLPVVEKVKMHGLSHVVDPSITEFNEGQVVSKIPISKLDTIFKEEPILGIKLDVENFEFEVLKGAESILRKQKPVIYSELWDNENRKNCFDFLRGLGYKSYYNLQGKLVFFEGNIKTTQTFFFL
jgi:FkbM family methyltransferase